MRILLTGGTGFIGKALLPKLLLDGHEVCLITRKTNIDRVSNNLRVLQADLNVFESYAPGMRSFKPEVLIHLAWQDIPDFSFAKSLGNLNSSLALLSEFARLKVGGKIIVSGSCFELGEKLSGPYSENKVGFVRDDFTWAKQSIRMWLDAMSVKGLLSYGWFRVFYAYGPGQRDASLIPSIFLNLMNGHLPNLNAPFNANDFIHVDDVADAFCKGVKSNLENTIYNIGFGKAERVIDICRLAENIVCGTSFLSDSLWLNAKNKMGSEFWADNVLTMSRLNWRPAIGLEEGLSRQWLEMKL